MADENELCHRLLTSSSEVWSEDSGSAWKELYREYLRSAELCLKALIDAERKWFWDASGDVRRRAAVFRAALRMMLVLDPEDGKSGSRAFSMRLETMARSGEMLRGACLDLEDLTLLVVAGGIDTRRLKRCLDWSRVLSGSLKNGGDFIMMRLAAAYLLQDGSLVPKSEAMENLSIVRMLKEGDRIAFCRTSFLNLKSEESADTQFRALTASLTDVRLNLNSSPTQLNTKLTYEQRKAAVRIASAILRKDPVAICGSISSGKSTILRLLSREASQSGPQEPIHVFLNGSDTTGFDSFLEMFGTLMPTGKGAFLWKLGPIGRAIVDGRWLIFEGVSENTPLDILSAIEIICRLKVGEEIQPPGTTSPACRLATGSGFSTFVISRMPEQRISSLLSDRWEIVSVPEINVQEIKWILTESMTPSESAMASVDRVLRAVKESKNTSSLDDFRDSGKLDIRIIAKILARIDSLAEKSLLTPITAAEETLDVLCGAESDGEVQERVTRIVADAWSVGDAELGAFRRSGKPILQIMDEGSLQIGRARLMRLEGARARFGLAETKSTLRTLEKVGRMLEQWEPVLLCGETGVGKTSLLQNLAAMTGNKLIAFNVSRETDVSQLLGGFRPLDVERELVSLARDFEHAFGLTLSRKKNLKFLTGLRRSALRTPSSHFLRLVESSVSSIPIEKRHSDLERYQAWGRVSKRLSKLQEAVGDHVSNGSEDKQARQCSRKSFVFVDGPLTSAIRTGSWILLDEINLAPVETLERLASILETRSVYLPDSGETLLADPSFRLVAAMNPPTDVGKRPIPDEIRRQFSELYVSGPKDEEDLAEIAAFRFYHRSRGSAVTERAREEKRLMEKVARFYISAKESQDLASGDDSLPNFSLRNLSRMLDCASSLRAARDARSTLSEERCLYEGALLSFGSSLNQSSKEKITALASREFLSTPMNSLLGGFQVGPGFMDIAGFPVRRGEQVGSLPVSWEAGDEYFHVTESFRRIIREISRALSIGSGALPVLLQGPTSAGKTSLVGYLARLTGNELVRINNHEHTDVAEYFGFYTSSSEGSLTFCDGPLVTAAKKGHWIVLDELNLAPPDVLESLNRLLDENREILVPETGEVVKAHPGFVLFATQNPPLLYGGRKQLSRAFRSRFVEIFFDEFSRNDLSVILEKRFRMPKVFYGPMLDVYFELQRRRTTTDLFGGSHGFVTPRDLFRWALRMPDSREDLARHGFFLLGERIRNSEERDMIKGLLIQTVKVPREALSDDILYEANRWRAIQSEVDWPLSLTFSVRRMLTLVDAAVQRREPVLLVGETGCGKTSVVQFLAMYLKQKLLIVNCHRGTEASDFLGSYRPSSASSKHPFSWVDGPLIHSMKQGGFILLDEVNMAEESVAERINSVLEPERSILLSEKGASAAGEVEIIRAHDNFRIFATMNPSGDFGKKELSPALRNRLTEIWIPTPCSLNDFYQVAASRLFEREEACQVIANLCLSLAEFLPVSMRDVSSLAEFILECESVGLSFMVSLLEGATLVFRPRVDASTSYMFEQALHQSGLFDCGPKRGIEISDSRFSVGPYRLPRRCPGQNDAWDRFSLMTKSSMETFLRLSRSLVLHRPVLLEGPPGIGKTASVTTLANILGVPLFRINLSEHTEMSDLVGTDSPGSAPGEFRFVEGPLLKAMQQGGWILLDELNLANQSVLEGLNSVLDHRRSVLVPDTGITVEAKHGFRLFGTQNPAAAGSGRKMLPASFLNRFSVIMVEVPDKQDISLILKQRFTSLTDEVIHSIVEVGGLLETRCKSLGLRDYLRWGQAVIDNKNLSPEDAFRIAVLPRVSNSDDRDVALRDVYAILGSSYASAKSKITQVPRLFVDGSAIQFGPMASPLTRGTHLGGYQGFFGEAALVVGESLSCAVKSGWPTIIRSESAQSAATSIRQFAGLAGMPLVELLLGSTSDAYDLMGSYEIVTFESRFAEMVETLDTLYSELLVGHMKASDSRSEWVGEAGEALNQLTGSLPKSSSTWVKHVETLISRLLEGGLTHSNHEEIRRVVEDLQAMEESKASFFKWTKSRLVQAVENGSWVLLNGIHFCPPAVLDRLNPILEGSSDKIFIAEAPCGDNMVSNWITPSQNFRIFMTCDASAGGNVSEALLSRSLLVDVEDNGPKVWSMRVFRLCPDRFCADSELDFLDNPLHFQEACQVYLLASSMSDYQLRVHHVGDLLAGRKETIKAPWSELPDKVGGWKGLEGSWTLSGLFPGLFDGVNALHGVVRLHLLQLDASYSEAKARGIDYFSKVAQSLLDLLRLGTPALGSRDLESLFLVAEYTLFLLQSDFSMDGIYRRLKPLLCSISDCKERRSVGRALVGAFRESTLGYSGVLFPSVTSRVSREWALQLEEKLRTAPCEEVADALCTVTCRSLGGSLDRETVLAILNIPDTTGENTERTFSIYRHILARASSVLQARQSGIGERESMSRALKIGRFGLNVAGVPSFFVWARRAEWISPNASDGLLLGGRFEGLLASLQILREHWISGRLDEEPVVVNSSPLRYAGSLCRSEARHHLLALSLGSSALVPPNEELLRGICNAGEDLFRRCLESCFLEEDATSPRLQDYLPKGVVEFLLPKPQEWVEPVDNYSVESSCRDCLNLGRAMVATWCHFVDSDPAMMAREEAGRIDDCLAQTQRIVEEVERWQKFRVGGTNPPTFLRLKKLFLHTLKDDRKAAHERVVDRETNRYSFAEMRTRIKEACDRLFLGNTASRNLNHMVSGLTSNNSAWNASVTEISRRLSDRDYFGPFLDVTYLVMVGIEYIRIGIYRAALNSNRDDTAPDHVMGILSGSIVGVSFSGKERICRLVRCGVVDLSSGHFPSDAFLFELSSLVGAWNSEQRVASDKEDGRLESVVWMKGIESKDEESDYEETFGFAETLTDDGKKISASSIWHLAFLGSSDADLSKMNKLFWSLYTSLPVSGLDYLNLEVVEVASAKNIYQELTPDDVDRCTGTINRFLSRAERIKRSLLGGEDHPVLDRLVATADRVWSMPKQTPITVLIGALQLLIQLAQEWDDRYGPKDAKFSDHTKELMSVITVWRKKEVESWPSMLDSRLERFSTKAGDWFCRLFYIASSTGIAMEEIVSIGDQFLRSSNFGDFIARLKVVETVGLLLIQAPSETVGTAGRRLLGMHGYYQQFVGRVKSELASGMKSLKEKAQELAKLSKWKEDIIQNDEETRMMDYHRLKTFGEVRRRKLHSILHQVDQVARSPLSNLILSELKKPIAVIDEREENAGHKNETSRLPIPATADGHLRSLSVDSHTLGSRMKTLSRIQERMFQLTDELPSRSTILRSGDAMRIIRDIAIHRTQDLSKRKNAAIAEKQRALTDLLRKLQRGGIPSFDVANPVSGQAWLGSPLLEVSECQSLLHLKENSQSATERFLKTTFLLSRLVSEAVDASSDIGLDRLKTMRNYAFHFHRFLTEERRVLHGLALKLERLIGAAHGFAGWSVDVDLSTAKKARIYFSQLSVVADDLHTLCNSLDNLEGIYDSAQLGLYKTNGEILEHCVRKSFQSREKLRRLRREVSEALKGISVPKDAPLPVHADLEFSYCVRELMNQFQSQIENVGSDLSDDLLAISDAPLAKDLCALLSSFLKFEAAASPGIEESSPADHSTVQISSLGERITEQIMIAVQNLQKLQEEPLDNPDEDLLDIIDSRLFRRGHQAILNLSSTLSFEVISTSCDALIAQLSILRNPASDLLDSVHNLGHFLKCFLVQVASPIIQESFRTHFELCRLSETVISIFVMLKERGFCRPEGDGATSGEEDGGPAAGEEDLVDGTGFGDLNDGEDVRGAKNVSDEVEDEGQLDDMEKDGNDQEGGLKPEAEEDGIEMDGALDGELGDVEDEADDNEEERDEEEGGDGGDQVDERLWDGEEDEEVEDDGGDVEVGEDGGMDEIAAKEDDEMGLKDRADQENEVLEDEMEDLPAEVDGDMEISSGEGESDAEGGEESTSKEGGSEVEPIRSDDENEDLDDDEKEDEMEQEVDGDGLVDEKPTEDDGNVDAEMGQFYNRRGGEEAEGSDGPGGDRAEQVEENEKREGGGNQDRVDSLQAPSSREETGGSRALDGREDVQDREPHLMKPDVNPFATSPPELRERWRRRLEMTEGREQQPEQDDGDAAQFVEPDDLLKHATGIGDGHGQAEEEEAGEDVSERVDRDEIPRDSSTARLENLTEKEFGTLKTEEESPENLEPIDRARDQRGLDDRIPGTVEIIGGDDRTDALETCELSEFQAPDTSVEARASFIPSWSSLVSTTSKGANALSQRLQLILEPTGRSRLGGSFKTGKRLNMRRVIEFVASDYKKDRIWMRRLRPDKREYEVLLAIDNSESMQHSGAGRLASEALVLLHGALARLEIGRIAVLRYGKDVEVLQAFDSPTITNERGDAILQSLNFNDQRTDLVSALRHAISLFESSKCTSLQGTPEQARIALIVSDGHLDDRETLRLLVRQARARRIAMVFIILDQPTATREPANGEPSENPQLHHQSIFDIRRAEYIDGKLSVKPYLDNFPFPFYAVVQNLESLPKVLGEALRQWLERIQMDAQ